MRKNLIKQFFALESASGLLIMAMTVLAIFWASSPFSLLHKTFIHFSLFSINECLMVFFFLLIGLELKREYKDGQLASFSHIALPFFAALGGMVVPGLIYVLCNYHDSIALRGWATPLATDIAFALAVLSFFGNRIPHALRLFLLALTIFDDIGAIIVIALFYSTGLRLAPLLGAMVVLAVLFLLNQKAVPYLLIYLLLGILLWFFLLHGGIHPTLAGVLLALFIPDANSETQSPLRLLEATLHPWVAYLILPVFALANAGFDLSHLDIHFFTNSIVIGIAAGLFFGKQLGIFGFTYLFIRLKLAKKIRETSWLMLYGVSLICGIGFTMSLFLGTLSFGAEETKLSAVRAGVFLGSVLSGTIGAFVLGRALSIRSAQQKRSRTHTA